MIDKMLNQLDNEIDKDDVEGTKKLTNDSVQDSLFKIYDRPPEPKA